ncbi:MAG: NUDIX domain-containing protein [Thermomicrobiales bacterium]|nr:NUDIX domain-containing protein [Thermomicrobiales bacterium]
MTNATVPQDPAEPFDVLTADGRPTGRVKPRAAIHRDGDWHRALHIWIAGKDPAFGAFLLLQRRSSRKDTWPGRLDTTVGGHFRAGETLAETLREVEEEIGIAPAGLALRPLGTRVQVNEAEPGVIDRELQEVYLLRDDRPLTAYRPNRAELSALARFPLETLIPFLAGDASEVDGEAIAPGANEAAPIVARPDEFIPAIDRYYLRVAIAAQNALRGDRYVAI